jgi:phage tail sheath gpL-like
VLAPDLADRFELTERNNLLYSGISTYTVADDGTVNVENIITTYQKNSYGDEDDSYLQVETLFSLMFVTRYLRTAVTSKFGRMKLAADGTRFAPGQPIVTPNIIKADQIAEYQTLVFNGYAQDAEAFAKNIISLSRTKQTRTASMCCGRERSSINCASLRCLTSSACRLNQQELKKWQEIPLTAGRYRLRHRGRYPSWWKVPLNISHQR